MKLLILHSSSDLYGASKILLTSLALFKKHGHEAMVVLSAKGELSEQLAQMDVAVIYMPLGIIRRKYMNPRGLVNRVQATRQAIKAIKEIIVAEKIELVYSNTTAVLAGAFAAKQLGIKHIWHVHEIIQRPYFLFRGLSYLLKHYADKIIVVSKAVQDHWAKNIPISKILLVYNGIDYSEYGSPAAASDGPRDSAEPRQTAQSESAALRRLVIGMIGRVHHWKGQDYFLQIAGELIKTHPHLQFVMVGDAFPGNEYLYENINRLKTELNLVEAVKDLGYQTNIPAILGQLDIFVLPSILPDPFPTVVLEAMAAGKAIVATNHGGATEMIESGKEGLLIPWNNAKAAAAIMEPIITDAALRKAMGAAAAKKVRAEFSLQAFEERILKLL
ncbi:glycosyltransferase family 4 protein [Sediminibacterium sp.]|uniref:glycosyltransferase family 4 protein n=1 Tax=Sediminibacterium sp. TaxID=1917865 RepID=UPI002735647A|nr:glycosyltransferase family 4 protein [Sediminibacterium sp.]MDP3392434.1 glycosyltransferase family 4 protein [Sediminibacterium sp.]MDP3565700.1 glycosyltransferase family 4 protein [Sediminibacterium sp.]